MIDYAYKIKMCPWKKWPVRTDGLPYFSSDVKLKVFTEQVKQKQREGHLILLSYLVEMSEVCLTGI